VVLPRVPERPFYSLHCLAKIIRKIVLIENQDRPPGRLEGLIPSPVAKHLCVSEVMFAVVLDSQAAMTITEVGRRRPPVSCAQ
jgi:hypothetical protein